MIIGKGVSKKATKRNKVKRVIMNEFRNEKKLMRVPGVDYLVIINSSDKLDGGDYKELTKELRGFLAKEQK